MSIRYLNNLTQLAANSGLSVDSQIGTLFGVRDGYSVLLTRLNNNYQFAISVAVCRDGELPDAKMLKTAVKDYKSLTGCIVQRYKATYIIKRGMSKYKTNENVLQALNDLTRFLRENSFQNCCQGCAKTGAADAYNVSGADALLCPECFTASSDAIDLRAQEQSRKPENVVGGIVGAFLGSLIGVAVIVIIGQLGFVASLSGVVMGVCTVKGYELLGGRLSNKGIVISIVLMLLMIYVGNRVDWALLIAATFEVGIIESFNAVPILYSEGYLTGYIAELLMVYGFAALGAIPTIINRVRDRENENVARKMISHS
ncbi:MAG: hypothetical protein ACOYJD_01080 [Christensenellales bacterium]|jgi:hypothetical protein